MKRITPMAKLQESIMLLEVQQAQEEVLLKVQFKDTYESLKPINLIKSTVDEFISSPNLKENILDTSLSLVLGYLSKKVVFGKTKNPFKQMIGSLIQMGVTNITSKNIPDIRSLITRLLGKKDKTIH